MTSTRSRTRSPGLLHEGLDHLESTVRELEKDWKRVQEKADRRLRQLERRAEHEFRRLEHGLRGHPLVQRAEEFASQGRRRLAEELERLLSGVGMASQADLARLERKLNALQRKLRTLEKERGTRSSRAA